MANVLCVDDETDIVDIFKIYVKRLGHEFLSAQNPSQALEIVRDNKIDLVITDYDLRTRVYGTDLFYMIRELGFEMPIILISGTPNLRRDPKINPEIWDQLFRFLEKPVFKDDFQDAVIAALKTQE